MVLRSSKYGKFYGCVRYPKCGSTHGAHDNGDPLGIPGNKETKLARNRAHAAFDPIWKEGHMGRRQAYAWMQWRMGLTEDEAHVAKFDVGLCEKLIQTVALLKRRWKKEHNNGKQDVITTNRVVLRQSGTTI